jgi:hypothetical protein
MVLLEMAVLVCQVFAIIEESANFKMTRQVLLGKNFLESNFERNLFLCPSIFSHCSTGWAGHKCEMSEFF